MYIKKSNRAFFTCTPFKPTLYKSQTATFLFFFSFFSLKKHRKEDSLLSLRMTEIFFFRLVMT